MIYELIKFTETKNMDALILSLDFEKCFDKIEFCALLGSLNFFDFPEYVTNWIKILYTDFKANTQNNGFFSKRFSINRGVHQGGPCSSLLFLICAEILALSLKNEEQIQGIPIEEMKKLLGQYADDADIYLLKKQKELDLTFEVLEKFHKSSGFTLNYDKTTIMRIGSGRFSNDMLITQRTVSWTNEPMNVLGVHVTTDSEKVESINYDKIVTKVNSLLMKWKNRSISLLAKIMLVNTLIMSLFAYKLTVLPALSDRLVKTIKHEIIKFLWNNARPKINYDFLIMGKKCGGAGLVDIKAKEKALKITWIQILENEPDLNRLVQLNNIPEIGNLIWECNLKPEDVRIFVKDKFWLHVYEAWFEFKSKNDTVSKDVQQIIWLNSDIRMCATPLYWKKAIKKGLIYVHQLIHDKCWISAREATEKYGLSVMSLNCLKAAIPRALQIKLKDMTKTNKRSITFKDMMCKQKNLARLAYTTFIQEKSLIPKIQKWETELNMSVDVDDFVKLFKDIYLITNIAKYRSFQYRLLHRGITTNIHMYHWGKISNNLCTFCEAQIESFSHLFVLCPLVQNVWISTEKLRMEFDNTDINFNTTNVLFNRIVNNPRNVKNMICLMLKQYIYRKRCHMQKPTFHEFKDIVYKMKTVERFIAVKNNKERLFYKKWGKNNTVLSYHEQNSVFLDNVND